MSGAGNGPSANRLHGAQSQPAGGDVAQFLAEILGRVPSHSELANPGRLLSAALRLADAEARLESVYRHYAEAQFQSRNAELDHMQDHLDDLLYFAKSPEIKAEVRLRILRLERASKFYSNQAKRLAGRYLREAQSSRDRALGDYLEVVERGFPN